MAIKVSAFHTYTHDLDAEIDTIENCVCCDALLENLKISFDSAQPPIFQITALVINEKALTDYQNTPLILPSYLESSLFCRPPPVLN